MNLKDALRTFRFKNKAKSYNQLYTQWGEKLDPENVLTEYPRPQLRRDNFTILNGYWYYSITKNFTRPFYYEGKILVPFSPESVLSGVNRQLKPDEVLWYERPLIIEIKPEGYRCILHFGAVDQRCEILINFKRVAIHYGGYLPFSVDITDYIEEGGNLLTVAVMDSSDTSYHSRGKQKLKRGGMFYTAQSGIWQTVWMEWVPSIYIERIKITPMPEQSEVRFEINLVRNKDKKNIIESSNPEELLYRIVIFDGPQIVQNLVSQSNVITAHLTEIKYWSPEQPFLYDVLILAGVDRVESYFAMRTFEVKPDEDNIARIFLNGKPYFQLGLLDQGYWPDGLYTAPSDEAMIYDIEKAKELGFNMLRKHCKLEPLRWYYHCDRLGVIVWQDIVNGGTKYNDFLVGYLPTLFPTMADRIKDSHYSWFARKSREGRKEWLRECRETVELLYNSPCVAVWVPFNEGWGQFDALKAVELIRSLDPHRLIDHASGWYDQQGGDFKSIHNYFHPYGIKPEKRAVVLSEFGGYACYIPEHSYSWQIYGYRIYLSTRDLDKAYRGLIYDAVEILPMKGLAAAVYTQLSDVEDEVNGLLTYDRKICKVTKPDIAKD